jgi:hypothetical protein
MITVKQFAVTLLVMGSVVLGQNPATSGDFGEGEFRQAVRLRLPQLSLTDATRFVLNHPAVAVRCFEWPWKTI